MKVKFVQPCEIEVFQQKGDEEGETVVFLPGQTAEFTIVGHPLRWVGRKLVKDSNNVNVRFANGTFANGIGCDWFEETIYDPEGA